ncbi:MAG: Protein translocase subunit SecE [Candidatus Tokpelaia hoelldobleri]|uniref:Protein translocase subunit SecE n=1 Tax=Candidatus Tokpelaia hoelldobleri TaxID=1902579 RepID=A0A1U9JTT9_9HYPH|nr:MAG: Protein translocase subunit SecE [Candidatus Tokpelaia hoelldoblerii]
MASKTSPATFFRQVRAEMAKVTWPVRREVGISTVMVLIMVVLAAMFFFLADVIIKFVITGGIGLLSSLFQSGL